MEQLDKQINYFQTEARRLKEKVSTLELQKEGLLTRYCYDKYILKTEIFSIKLNDLFIQTLNLYSCKGSVKLLVCGYVIITPTYKICLTQKDPPRS